MLLSTVPVHLVSAIPVTISLIYLTLYSVRDYMRGVEGRVFVDARRFWLMQYAWNRHMVYNDRRNEEQLTGVGI